jgi:hypothetical protein
MYKAKFPIKFINDCVIVNKKSGLVASILLSALLSACSGNNGGSEATSNVAGAADTPTTTSTGSTGTGLVDTVSTTGTTGTGSDVGGTSGGDGSTTGTGTTGTGSDVGGTSGGDGSTTGTGTTGTVSDVGGTNGDDGSTTGTGTTGTGGDVGGTGDGSTTAGSFPAYFTKLGNDGSTLPSDASAWSCILDNRTGLVWEVKTNDGGLRDQDWRYKYNGSSGLSPAGTDYPCVGVSACNPISYVEALNTYGVCGKTNWHLPTGSDMAGIAEPHDAPPHINLAAFSIKTDLPYCIAKVTPGNYIGFHFGVEIPVNADLLTALNVDMSNHDFECRVLSVSNQ